MPASAAVTPDCITSAAAAVGVNAASPDADCCSVTSYKTTNKGATYLVVPGIPQFKDGPGGTITVSNTYSGTVGYSITAGSSFDVGAIVASAHVSVSASIQSSYTVSLTHTYSHNIASGKYGHVRYQATAYKVAWQKVHLNANCTSTVQASGQATFPTTETGWYFWETTS